MAMNTALFIDVENVKHQHVRLLIAHLCKNGCVSARIAIGAPEKFIDKRWKETAINNSLDCRCVFSMVKGKDASDHVLNVVVMDFINDPRNNNVTNVCIMSSDSDFAAIRNKLIQSGLTVIIAGDPKISCRTFVSSSDSFVDVTKLEAIKPKQPVKPKQSVKPKQPKAPKGLQTHLVTKGEVNSISTIDIWLEQVNSLPLISLLNSTLEIEISTPLDCALARIVHRRLTTEQYMQLSKNPNYHLCVAIYINQHSRTLKVTPLGNDKYRITKTK
ncbi:NYN domain-containing protein [Photobacterium phosphoreum]|uniref:NYN domain-containing protein n=1 Tax=Photobacterium phosphoreum TaxID=659 RepID=UPI0024B6868F|nr:NYN domain-containing protein [Photobacterium phosphoreum]